MRKSGFTLVELMVVMVIILILAGIGLKNYAATKERAKNAQVKSGVHEIQVALEEYAIDHSNFYPGINWDVISNELFVGGVGTGVLGGVESEFGKNDFTTWVDDTTGTAYYGDQTPRAVYIDMLIENRYLARYPANPFLTSGDSTRSQMTNLLWFAPDVATGLFTFTIENFADWNKLTYRGEGQTMKINYDDRTRGHFTYIPLNPVNNQGWDYSQWSDLPVSAQAQYYKHCRSYMLIGWGASRIDTTVSKGFSSKYYFVDTTDPVNPVPGYDLDRNLRIDPLEANLELISLPEQEDSSGSTPLNYGALVGVPPNQFEDIDDGLAGATIILTSG